MSDKDKNFTSSLEHKIDGLIKDFGEYKAFNTKHLKNLDQRLKKVEESSKKSSASAWENGSAKDLAGKSMHSEGHLNVTDPRSGIQKEKVIVRSNPNSEDEYIGESDEDIYFPRRKSKVAHATIPSSDPHSKSGNSGFQLIQMEELQSEYRAIADSLARQRLSRDLHFQGSKSGVKASAKPMANAVTASARYVETCLKLAVNIQASCKDDINPEKEVGELVVCLLAHLWYLQEEFTNVLVVGKFGDTTQGIFHQLQQNTSAFTPSTIENIKSAIALSTAQHQQQTAQSQTEFGRSCGQGFGD